MVRAAVVGITEQSLNWTVAVARSTASITARASHARLAALIAIAAALAAGLGLAFALSFWLARPISSLETYAARVRAGDRVPAPRAAVEALGGEIGVHSTSGAGTRITMRFAA